MKEVILQIIKDKSPEEAANEILKLSFNPPVMLSLPFFRQMLEKSVSDMVQCINDSQGEQDWGEEIRAYELVISHLKWNESTNKKGNGA
jgi:hypothetical protein